MQKNSYKDLLKIKLFIVILFCSQMSVAQIGGGVAYDFLNLSNSSRVTAMGSDFLCIYDGDISLALSNPSLINEDMHNRLSVNYVDHFTDINYGYSTYSRTFDNIGSFAASLQYINYGEFTYADPTGVTTGKFTANEMAMIVGWSKQLADNWYVGANVKGMYSQLESYYSSALAFDFAGSYVNQETNFCASLIVKNAGRQIKPYVEGNIEPIPFEIQMGLSKRLEHVPFRFSLLFDNLQKWNLTYDDPTNPKQTIDPLTGEEITERKVFTYGDQALRHITIGGEMLFGESFSVRFGYNYRKRKEMVVDTRFGMVGFSWGFGIKISKFQISYARAAYHLAGAPNVFTITTNISDFKKSKSE